MGTEVAELALIIDSSEATRGIKRLETRLEKMGNKANTETKKAQGGFQRLKKSVFSLRGAFISLGALAFLRKAVKSATEFEKKMKEVQTLVDDTFAFDKLTSAVEDLSVEFGKSAPEQAAAAYQVISAGATSAANAIEVLTVANELALGGVTDVTTAVDGLTSTMNAYGPSVGTAASVSDRFFIAVKAGKTTVEELSRTIGLVAPVAANLGISLDEVLAATAALTKGGIKTSIAMAGLRQVMASVLKPTSEAAMASERLGIDFNAAALKGKGLQGFLKDVIDKTKGSTTELGLLFGSVEALVPILALAGQAGEDFEKILDDMSKSGGATKEAVDKMKESFDFKFAKFNQGSERLIRNIGKDLLPLLSSLIDIVDNLTTILPRVFTSSFSAIDKFLAKYNLVTKILLNTTLTIFDSEKRADNLKKIIVEYERQIRVIERTTNAFIEQDKAKKELGKSNGILPKVQSTEIIKQKTGDTEKESVVQLKKENKINDLILNAQRNLLTEKEKINIDFQRRKDTLELASVEGNLNQQIAADELIIALEAQKNLKLEELENKHQKKISSAKNRAFIFAEQLRDRDFSGALQSAQALTQGLAATSKKAFEINKTAGIASAIINTYQGVTKALAELPPPYSYVAAAVTLAAGFAKVNAIRSTSFSGGGGGGGSSPRAPSFAGSGGGIPSGVGDGTTSSFNGGEISSGSVTKTPDGTTRTDGNGNIKIINAFDFEAVGDYLSTEKGEKVIMNVIKRNKKALKQI